VRAQDVTKPEATGIRAAQGALVAVHQEAVGIPQDLPPTQVAPHQGHLAITRLLKMTISLKTQTIPSTTAKCLHHGTTSSRKIKMN
jgi:hypothetical protein